MLPKRERTERVVVHFTGTTSTQFEDLVQAHREEGEAELGYHFVIDAAGKLLMGRHQSRVGAHYPEFDANSVGVIVFGERFSISEEQEVALILLLDKLRADFPSAEKVNYIYHQAAE